MILLAISSSWAINLLIALLIIAAVVYVVIKIFQMIGVPQPIMSIITVIIALILFLILLDKLDVHHF